MIHYGVLTDKESAPSESITASTDGAPDDILLSPEVEREDQVLQLRPGLEKLTKAGGS